MQSVGHERLEADVLDAGHSLRAVKVLFGTVAAFLALAQVVHQVLGDLTKRTSFLSEVHDHTSANEQGKASVSVPLDT